MLEKKDNPGGQTLHFSQQLHLENNRLKENRQQEGLLQSENNHANKTKIGKMIPTEQPCRDMRGHKQER